MQHIKITFDTAKLSIKNTGYLYPDEHTVIPESENLLTGKYKSRNECPRKKRSKKNKNQT